MASSMTLETVYRKLSSVEHRLKAVEHALLPEVRLSKKTLARLESARKSLKAGNGLSLKDYLATGK